MVCRGSELEAGWLPQMLRQGANGKVQPGAPGHFEATRFAPLREMPAALDRSLGDIHAGGNPDIQTDPRNMLPVTKALAQRLTQIDPDLRRTGTHFSGTHFSGTHFSGTHFSGTHFSGTHFSGTHFSGTCSSLNEFDAMPATPGGYNGRRGSGPKAILQKLRDNSVTMPP